MSHAVDRLTYENVIVFLPENELVHPGADQPLERMADEHEAVGGRGQGRVEICAGRVKFARSLVEVRPRYLSIG